MRHRCRSHVDSQSQADSRRGGHGGHNPGRLVGFGLRALPADQCPEGVSVARAHGVVDHEVEGGVDVS